MPAASGLPKHLEEQRTQVVCGPDLNYHVSKVVHVSKPRDSESLYSPAPYSLQTSTQISANMFMALGISNAWDLQQWVENFRIKVQSKDSLDMKFDMVGIDPAIANAFRRILIAEVPTMAIEHVFYINNTSIITVCGGLSTQWSTA